MITVNWLKVWQVTENLLVIIGAVVVVLALVRMLTHGPVVSFLEEKWRLFASAGLLLGGICAVWLAYHTTSGHPLWSANVLIWIGMACFIATICVGIFAHLPRRVKEVQGFVDAEEAPLPRPAELG